MTSRRIAAIGNLMVHLAQEAACFLSDDMGLETRHAPERIGTGTAFISSSLRIRGDLHGCILMSAGEATTFEIMRRLLDEQAPADELPELLQETICEVLNVIVGKTTQSLEVDGLRVILDAPVPGVSTHLAATSHHPRYLVTEKGPVILAYSEVMR